MKNIPMWRESKNSTKISIERPVVEELCFPERIAIKVGLEKPTSSGFPRLFAQITIEAYTEGISLCYNAEPLSHNLEDKFGTVNA